MNQRLAFNWVLLLSILLFTGLGARSQIKVSGSIIDGNGGNLPYAAAVLLNSADSSLVTGTTADENGKFSLEVKAGDYLFKSSFLSFESTYILLNNLTANKNLGKVTLSPKAQALEEFEVQAERSMMTMQIDKRVFNVGSDLSTAGGTVIDVLENVPSVTVDVDGNVGLRGSTNARILIDGKPSGLTGAESLQLLQASMIDKIEVITNPSAKYEAEGEAGIINIVLKKDKRQNLNGVVELNTGWPHNHSASYNLNYRKNKINFFSNYAFNYQNNPSFGESQQRFTNGNEITYLRTDRERERGGYGHNIRFGLDYMPNANTTFTLSGQYRYSNNNNAANTAYEDLGSFQQLLFSSERDEAESEIKNNREINLGLERKFEGKDHKLTADIRFYDNTDRENSTLNQFVNDEIEREQTISNVEDERFFLAQADYVKPIKNGKLETGIRSTYRFINNVFQVKQKPEGAESFSILQPFDNDFEFTELIYAGYGIWSAELGSFSYQAGLRGEFTDMRTLLTKTNEGNVQQYFNFFPSAHISKKLNEKHSLQASYTRRISRPDFRALMPFYGYSDNRNFWAGNPNLIPEYTDSYDLGWLTYFKKGSILSSVYYRHRVNVVERITVTDSIGFTRRIPVNLATQDAYGFEFALNYNFNRQWSFNANANLFRAITVGSYEGQSLRSDTYTANGRMNLRYKWKKVADIQLSSNLQAPQITTQGRQKGIYTMNAGLSRDVLKNKGTLTFNVRDIFNTGRYQSTLLLPDLYGYSWYQRRVRQFNVSFSYRINQQKGRERQARSYDGGDYE